MKKQTIRIRKVGSVTFGIVLIITGVIYMLQMFFPNIDYHILFHFWPLILILLGVEVLAGSRSRQKWIEVLDEEGRLMEQQKISYDVPAMFLTFGLTAFAMVLGMADHAYHYYGTLHL